MRKHVRPIIPPTTMNRAKAIHSKISTIPIEQAFLDERGHHASYSRRVSNIFTLPEVWGQGMGENLKERKKKNASGPRHTDFKCSIYTRRESYVAKVSHLRTSDNLCAVYTAMGAGHRYSGIRESRG